MKLRVTLTLAVLLALLAGVSVLRLSLGGGEWHGPVLRVRAANLAGGALVGASLAVAGVFLQSLLRNPLASPDLLGLASGSGFAVMIVVKLGLISAGVATASGLGAISTTAAALLGAMGALALTYILSRKQGVLDPLLLVLNGVVISIICSAGTMLVRHLLPFSESGIADRMLRGALREDITPSEFILAGTVTILGIVVGMSAGRSMDAASLTDDEAVSVGVPLGALRRLLFVLSGILTATSVVLAGPIGFVGLICPHVVRLMAGPGHRVLVLGSALAGAALVIGASAIVRAVDLPTGRLPIGVVTAIIGGPVFIAMLRRQVRSAVL